MTGAAAALGSMVQPQGAQVAEADELAPLGWLKLSDDEEGQAPQEGVATIRQQCVSLYALSTDGLLEDQALADGRFGST